VGKDRHSRWIKALHKTVLKFVEFRAEKECIYETLSSTSSMLNESKRKYF
jgi:hypothetical protein